MHRVIAITPPHHLSPSIAIAACRAGASGILDLGYGSNRDEIVQAAEQLSRGVDRAAVWGIRWDTLSLDSRGLKTLSGFLPRQVPLLVIAGVDVARWSDEWDGIGRMARRVFAEVNDLPSARAAAAAGAHGLIVKGHESGGRVGPHSTFILLQELRGKLDIPFWVQGGVGLRSAGAAALAGAAGVVLCEQLWLTSESPLARGAQRAMWSSLDGSETVPVGQDSASFRVFSRAGRARFRELDQLIAQGEPWTDLLWRSLSDSADPLLPLGQDIALAGHFAKRFGTVGRVITAINDVMDTSVDEARQQQALDAHSPLAATLGVKYPVVQGPMTRVSDTSNFAEAVAHNGGLPVLALSVMRRDQVRALLQETQSTLVGKPWGIGLLGFLPLDFRQEQMEVIREFKPPFAIIAGGRPSQARELEALSIATYLHVPSPALLAGFLKEGARKFIFEGSECGGHTGPRTSFILWESAIEILLTAELDDPGEVRVLFAGGIHDALSAAMVSVVAAPLVARGMQIGVVMGTAYLFTKEIVGTGAINREFQTQAIACQETTLLQSGAGIYTRCAKTAFCDEFNRKRQELILAKEADEDILKALELLNIGRLRIAAKGIARSDEVTDAVMPYVDVDVETQRREGMYMLGEVARLRDAPLTIAQLHEAVASGSREILDQSAKPLQAERNRRRTAAGDIAVIGMACIMPKAPDTRSYWHNICRQVDAITEVSEERWRGSDFYDPKRGAPDKVCSKWGGFLDDVQFDPTVFGIPPASMTSIDAAQLLALEVARRALDDAGLSDRPFPRERTTTIFAAPGTGEIATAYTFRTLLDHYLPKIPGLPDEIKTQIVQILRETELPKWSHYSFPGILSNVIAGRVANRLDLGGTNYTVDAACASSLAALDAGIRQLRSGDADVALVGAVDGTNTAPCFMAFAQTYALSPSGHCRSFDDSADGIAIGEGVGALVLKRLADAERDGDRIYAVIKGIGSSSDGRNKSLTAPHPQGQIRALQRAYTDAGIDPATVTLIEAHGTGTTAGDKSEIDTLNSVFGDRTPPQTCAVGSVKSMIGHTKIAAGLAGLVKGVLALDQRVLPPSIGVDHPNAGIDFAASPFYINTETRPWLAHPGGFPRRCGVSAFGFGGTNFHAVLEEYTGRYRDADTVNRYPRPVEPFIFAGDDRSSVAREVERLKDSIAYPDQLNLAQLAYAHYCGRQNSNASGAVCRLALLATSVADLCEKLELALRAMQDTGNAEFRFPQGVYFREKAHAAAVCLLFPGQGSQKVNMLRELVVAQPSLYEVFERADTLLADRVPQILSRVIYPVPVFSDEVRQGQQATLNETQLAQPALGVVEVAAARLLQKYGITPDFVAGHSYGEYVALCVAGVMGYDDLIRISEARGRIVADAGRNCPGTMAAVAADGARTGDFLSRHGLGAYVANLNAPEQTIIAGTCADIDAAVAASAGDNLRVTRLAVNGPFHSPLVAAAREALEQELTKIKFSKPSIPVFSNTLRGPYPSKPDQIRSTLAKHLAEPVSFVDEVNSLYEAGAQIFIEAGPGQVLSGLVANILKERPHVTLALDSPGRNGWVQLAHLLCHGFALGIPIDFAKWFGDRGMEEMTLGEVLEAARHAAEPGPMVWRVNGGHCKPWHERPRKKIEFTWDNGTSHVDAAVSPAIESRLSTTLENPSPDRENNSTEKHQSTSTAMPLNESATSAQTDARLALIQQSVNQFIELQTEQQRTLRRFLDFLEASLGSDGSAEGGGVQGSQFGQRAPTRPQGSAEMGGQSPLGVVLPTVVSAPLLPPEVMAVADSAAATAPPPSGQAPLAPSVAIGEVAAPARQEPTVAPAGLHATEQFKFDLLRIVAERTGYPQDMLGLDAQMEADLGIDSIKRIEIFAALKDSYSFMEGRDEEAVFEELSGLKTLNQIIGWYDRWGEGSDTSDLSATQTAGPLAPRTEALTRKDETSADPVRCYALTPVSAPPASNDPLDPCSSPVLLLGPSSAACETFWASLKAAGYTPWLLTPGQKTRMTEEGLFEVDFGAQDAVDRLQSLVEATGKVPGGLICLLGATDDGALPANTENPARLLFQTLKAVGPHLNRSAESGAGWLVNLTSMDGQFGLGRTHDLSIHGAGTLGVAKSAAREWPRLRVKCIDLHPDLQPDTWAALVLGEVSGGDTQPEVGYTKSGRWHLDLVPRDRADADLSVFPWPPGAVILVTGGALGITAEAIKGLAKQGHCVLILVGRSPLPEDEPEGTRSLMDVSALRQYLIEEQRTATGKVKPAEIEIRLKEILKQRTLRDNLAAIKNCGAEVYYETIDVRDADAFGELIDEIYAQWGRIDGVVHGAGVIDDKLICDKSVESFEYVYETKVHSALTLATKLQPDTLKFLVLFSSVSGRFGNFGQSDYSAANEVLNKLADRLSIEWPGVRTVSINWGPWDSGMVNEELRRLYAARNIGLIPIETGVDYFLSALSGSLGAEPELVITSSLEEIATAKRHSDGR